MHALEGIYRAYISSLGTKCVHCIRTVTVPPQGVIVSFDFTNLCADLGLGVDLLCTSGGEGGGGGKRTQRTPPPQPTRILVLLI